MSDTVSKSRFYITSNGQAKILFEMHFHILNDVLLVSDVRIPLYTK